MKEQERYVHILKKIINQTENEHIQSSEEIIDLLVYELSANKTTV